MVVLLLRLHTWRELSGVSFMRREWHTLAQSCPTLFDPMDRSPPGSSVHGILQASILEWIAISSSKGSSWPRDQTHTSCISCIAGGFFTPRALREAPLVVLQPLSCLTVYDPVGCSMPGSSVLYCLLEFAQIHVCWVSDAIQPSHPCCPLLLPSISPSIRLFSNESALHIRWPE